MLHSVITYGNPLFAFLVTVLLYSYVFTEKILSLQAISKNCNSKIQLFWKVTYVYTVVPKFVSFIVSQLQRLNAAYMTLKLSTPFSHHKLLKKNQKSHIFRNNITSKYFEKSKQKSHLLFQFIITSQFSCITYIAKCLWYDSHQCSLKV